VSYSCLSSAVQETSNKLAKTEYRIAFLNMSVTVCLHKKLRVMDEIPS
jgi:hypothetical protein